MATAICVDSLNEKAEDEAAGAEAAPNPPNAGVLAGAAPKPPNAGALAAGAPKVLLDAAPKPPAGPGREAVSSAAGKESGTETNLQSGQLSLG